MIRFIKASILLIAVTLCTTSVAHLNLKGAMLQHFMKALASAEEQDRKVYFGEYTVTKQDCQVSILRTSGQGKSWSLKEVKGSKNIYQQAARLLSKKDSGFLESYTANVLSTADDDGCERTTYGAIIREEDAIIRVNITLTKESGEQLISARDPRRHPRYVVSRTPSISYISQTSTGGTVTPSSAGSTAYSSGESTPTTDIGPRDFASFRSALTSKLAALSNQSK